jgi:4-diphosphocytidyl-2-C-methyl-D-erythritol kinase
MTAPAKINLFLEIKNKRPDGYHNLESIMQTVSLYDKLYFNLTKKNIVFKCNDKSLSTHANIVYKTAKAVKTRFKINNGVEIYLKKEIPVAAGLGGGSSDAAATLKALINLWNIKTTKTELNRIASKLGADVSFFLTGGTALCEGIGEKITPLKSINKLNIILINPGFGIMTTNVYKNIKFPFTNPVKIHRILSLIHRGNFDVKSAYDSCFNRLEEFVLPDCPEIVKIKNILDDLGCISLMSGSGTTVFGIFDLKVNFKMIRSKLSRYGWKVWFVNAVDFTSQF